MVGCVAFTSLIKRYTAFWDGKLMKSGRSTGKDAPSGIYIFLLDIDGQTFTRKMFVAK